MAKIIQSKSFDQIDLPNHMPEQAKIAACIEAYYKDPTLFENGVSAALANPKLADRDFDIGWMYTAIRYLLGLGAIEIEEDNFEVMQRRELLDLQRQARAELNIIQGQQQRLFRSRSNKETAKAIQDIIDKHYAEFERLTKLIREASRDHNATYRQAS